MKLCLFKFGLFFVVWSDSLLRAVSNIGEVWTRCMEKDRVSDQ